MNNYKIEQLICLICGYETNNRQSFNSHIAHAHHIKSKDYYDMFLKKENEGICLTCGKPTKFRDMWYGYNKHCCTKCIPLDPKIKEQTKQTNNERYGVDYTWQADSVKEKIEQTMLNNYGVKSYLQTPECREKTYESIRSKEVRDKIEKTTFEHFGVKCSTQSTQMKEKTKQTKKERYGDENYNNIEKAKQTNKERYGYENPAQNPEIREKMYATCSKNHGVDNIWKDRDTRIKAKQKAQKNMYKNGNHSSLEDYLEMALQKANIPYQVEYNLDNRYPYFCDFYLPDKDLFVEINGYFTHGGHWFDENNEKDIKKLQDITEKSKIHSMYKTFIRVWTDSDVCKRKCAKQNKLNYVVLWNKKDIENWIKSDFEIRHDY